MPLLRAHLTKDADFQAFLNNLSVEIDVFFYLLTGGVKQTAKNLHFVDFDWEKCIEMA